MSKKITNKLMVDDALPIGQVTRIKDTLPPPSELVARDDSIKVTLALSAQSIAFFKTQAKQNNVPYQRMIRNLVDQYVVQHTPPV